jgi:hypothetical protein
LIESQKEKREDEAVMNLRGLDLTRRDGRLLVVSSELASLGCNTLEDVVDEGVQDGHGTVGDTSVGVDLLEDCGKRRVSECWD